MRKTLLFLMIAAPLLAQSPPPDGVSQSNRGPRRPGRAAESSAAEAAADPTAVSTEGLLLQVRVDAQQLAPQERAFMLGRLALTAQRVEPKLVRPTVDELFQVAAELPAASRASVQNTGVMAIADLDPEYALQLLERMEPPVASADGNFSDPRTNAASNVFSRYWAQTRGTGLDKLRGVASHLADTGSYPYSAFSSILRQLRARDPATVDALFGDALHYYRGSSGSLSETYQFVQLLGAANRVVPDGLFREGVTMAVTNAERHQADTQLMTETIGLPGNEAPKNIPVPTNVMLGQLLSLVRQIDPAWAQRIIDANPNISRVDTMATNMRAQMALRTGAANGGGGGMSGGGGMAGGGTFGGGSVLRPMSANADPATVAAAGAQMAGNFGQNNPQQATVLLDQARQTLDQLQDPLGQLKVLASLAQGSYATGHRDDAAKYMERGFTLGDEVVRQDFDDHPDRSVTSLNGVNELVNLTRTAMKIDPRGTVVRITGVRYPLLRAYLTLSAAEALQQDRRFGQGFGGGMQMGNQQPGAGRGGAPRPTPQPEN